MLRLLSPHLQPDDAPLDGEAPALLRLPSGQLRVEPAGTQPAGGDCLATFAPDPAGCWMHLQAPGLHVHLNGRPVSRLALVRGGDVLHVEGLPLQVAGRAGGTAAGDYPGLPVLRAHGGPLHGRALALHPGQGVVISDGQAQPGLPAAQEAGIRRQGRRVVLQVPDPAAGVQLNGLAVRGEAPLAPGDQVVAGPDLRLVLESAHVPGRQAEAVPAEAVEEDEEAPPPSSTGSIPWLLLAALVSAALLAALLLFGAR